MPVSILIVLVLGAPESHEEIVSALASPSRHVREGAVERLAHSGPPVEDLAELLIHPDVRVAVGAAAILSRRGEAAALEPLARAVGHDDPERGAAAARALVELGMALDQPVSSWARNEREKKRLRAATRRVVDEGVSQLTGRGSADRPYLYRRYFVGEMWAAEALESIARDPERNAGVRSHALMALRRLAGNAAYDVFRTLLTDPDPSVRAQAASALYRCQKTGGYADLARLLEGDQPIYGGMELWAVLGATKTRRVSTKGAAELARVVREGRLASSVRAAKALRRALGGKKTPDIVQWRVRRLLRAAKGNDKIASGAALYHLKAGPLPEDLLEVFRQSHDPILRAVATNDRDEALALLDPVLDPEASVERNEYVRVEVCYWLLWKHNVGWDRRIRFALSVLSSDRFDFRRKGTYLLQGCPKERLVAPLLPALQRLLGDPYETVSVGAGSVLARAGDREGLDALLIVIYDGDRWATGYALRALKASPFRLDPVGLERPPAERRRWVRQTRAKLAETAPR